MPAIKKPNQHFDATLYTGTGSSLSVTNAGSFQPDFVWAKNRGLANYNALTDSVRGVQNQLYSNTNDAQVTGSDGLTAFNTNGFTVGTNANWNNNTYSFVGWQWKGGGTAVTNTAGATSSQVSANPTAGFSVVTYTGTGSSTSIGHGLGAVPSVILIKSRSATTAWRMYQADLGITKYLVLSSTNGVGTASMWGTPTDTAFVVGGTSYEVNDSSATYVAYCWAPIAGYSAFGSYTGNGSSDGPFVYLGFRPRFIMIKRSDTIANWTIRDTARNSYNSANLGLFPNLSNAEDSTSGRDIDILSNGFKIRGTDSDLNTSSGTYIYACWAENPFKYANAR
jgi:hypothetical protein